MTATREIPSQPEHASDESERSLRHEWEAVYGHPLTENEFQEVVDNVSALFRLLHEWDLADRREVEGSADQDDGLQGGECK